MFGIDDLMEKEVAIAVAATAIATTRPLRKLLRKGAVYGLTGVLLVGDGVSAVARGIGRGFRETKQPEKAEPEPIAGPTGAAAAEPAGSAPPGEEAER